MLQLEMSFIFQLKIIFDTKISIIATLLILKLIWVV